MPKQKYYVVWKGRKPGIFTSWADCEKQVKGVVAAEYKAFGTLKEAESAYKSKYEAFKGKSASNGKWKESETPPIIPSICGDADFGGYTGKFGYDCVERHISKELRVAG